MKTEDRQIDDSTPNRRQWFRWHWSSIILTALSAALFSLIIVPGQQFKISWSVIEHWEFGWPAIYLVQIPEHAESFVEDPLPFTWAERRRGHPSPDYQFWSDRRSWELFGDHPQTLWNYGALALNVSILGSASLIIGALAEYRRRNRRKFWQVSLFDLLLLTFLIATPLGIHQNRIRRAQNQMGIIQELWERESAQVSFNSEPPVWLERLLDFRHSLEYNAKSGVNSSSISATHPLYAAFEKVSFSGELNPDEMIQDTAETTRQVNRLQPKQLDFYRFDSSVAKLLKKIDPRFVEKIRVGLGGKRCDFSVSIELISRFRKLKSLTLLCRRIDFSNAKVSPLQKLETLQVYVEEWDDETVEWILDQPHLKTVYVSRRPQKLFKARPDFEIKDRFGNVLWTGNSPKAESAH